jgi:hypothetical protein
MKTSPCLLGAGLLGAKMVTMLVNKNTSSTFKAYHESLSPSQKMYYDAVVEERLHLYLKGLLIGLVISTFLIKFANFQISDVSKACLFTVIIMGTGFMYYMLMPKTKYMLEVLNDDQQNGLWLAVYREMQLRYWGGFFLGIVAFGLIGYSLNLSS